MAEQYRYNCIVGGVHRQLLTPELGSTVFLKAAQTRGSPKRRGCAEPGCITVLSGSNEGTKCRRHQDTEFMRATAQSLGRTVVRRRNAGRRKRGET